MALPTFDPPCQPSPGLTDTPEVKVTKAEFGDGYQQATASMNNVRRIVEASWDVLEKEEAADLEAFFRTQRGFLPFYYAFPHDDVPAKWTVETWSNTIGAGDYHRITATFRQSFTLAT